MKRWMLTLLMMSCALAQAAAIDRYVTRLDIQPDCAGVVRLEMQVAPCQPGGLSLPVGFGGVDALQVLAAPQGTQRFPKGSRPAWQGSTSHPPSRLVL